MSYPKKIRLKIIWTKPMLEQYYKQFNTYDDRAIYKQVTVNSKEEEEYMLETNRRDAAVLPDIINNWKE